MNKCIYDAFGRGVCVCVSVCLSVCMVVCARVNLKTVADICVLFGSYVDCRKISGECACQGYFFRGFKRYTASY